MNYFENNKRYLDSNGLKALILKIKELYTLIQDNAGDINQLTADLNNTIERVENIENVSIPGLQDLIDAIRAELGDTPAEGTPNVYARLDAVETAIEALEGRADALEARADELEKITVHGIEKFEYVAADKKIYLNLDTDNTDKAAYSAEIDVTDFIIDGMIEDVKLVTVDGEHLVTNDHQGMPDAATTQVDYTTYQMQPDLNSMSSEERTTWFTAHAGHKFLMMIFNRTEKADADPNSLKAVLVETTALFNDYDFHAEVNASEEDYKSYVSFNVAEIPGDANNVNDVTYTLSLNADLVNDLKLVEGKFAKDPDNASAGNYRGIKSLDEDLAAAEGKIEVLENSANDADARLTALEASVDGVEADGSDGLLARATALEAWVDDQSIPVEQLDAVFDKIIYGTDMPETSYDWFDPATDLPTP